MVLAKSRGTRRECITRTACAPCREKRAKCDGGQPCSRCRTRDLNCHFTSRVWASKRSLQDNVSSLREQLHHRDCVLGALSRPGPRSDEVIRMLRQHNASVDDVFIKLEDNAMTADTGLESDTQQVPDQSDCEASWCPSMVDPNIPSFACNCASCGTSSIVEPGLACSAPDQSPVSLMDSAYLPEKVEPQPVSSKHVSDSRLAPRQQNDPALLEKVPWTGPDETIFNSMVASATMPMNTRILDDCSADMASLMCLTGMLSDPKSSQPILNSWMGVMGETVMSKPGFYSRPSVIDPSLLTLW